MTKQATNRLIVALDVPSAAAAHKLVTQIAPATNFFKIGKQLFTAEGPQFVRELTHAGHEIFLDLKYHDIPNTVAMAVSEASKLGAAMLNVHASGGSKMLRAAADATKNSPNPPLVLAVTVLTSLNQADLNEIGVSGTPLEQVLRLATLAQRSGCDGVVASPAEASAIRREVGSDFVIVTPGVRPTGSASNDQSRVTTPAEAIAAGADYIVVGRPITAANDPAAAARSIVENISGVHKEYAVKR